ncbi:MAG: hypothetical protein KGJ57_17500 [Sphingomonadales bacterium]|nr:hypothetical protein [Sphingomonadales bacterium]MDE2171194.1 hypothetical protein [Sphingomonadales bacterium]
MSKKSRGDSAGITSKDKEAAKSKAKKAMLDPVMAQAISNGARLDRGEFATQYVPNPFGEVMKDGLPVRHPAVKRKPQYELLRSRNVITAQQEAALAWYADRLALAESGMISNPLAGNGGGAAGSGIPISEARMDALRDVEWARQQIAFHDGETDGARIGVVALEVFDAVMAEEISFIEAARRERANRYVRISMRRRQDQIRELFVAAAKRLQQAHGARFRQGSGRIEGGNDGVSTCDQWLGRNGQ